MDIVSYTEQKCKCSLTPRQIKELLAEMKTALSAMAALNPEFGKVCVLLDLVMKLLCRYETINRETLLNLAIFDTKVYPPLRYNLKILHEDIANKKIEVNTNIL